MDRLKGHLVLALLTTFTTALDDAVAALEVDCLHGEDARRLVQAVVAVERRLGALRMAAGRRAAASGIWRTAGFRSPEDWLASETGAPVGVARRSLRTAERLEKLPELAGAAKHGAVSERQLETMAEAAADAPGSERRLLEAVHRRGTAGLREEAGRVRAEAQTEASRRERTRRVFEARHVRHWMDGAGASHVELVDTPDRCARLLAAVERRARRHVAEARKQGRREPAGAYQADALLALVEQQAPPPVDAAGRTERPGRRRAPGTAEDAPQAVISFVVDAAAFFRGDLLPGERCEIPGVGPVPLATVERYFGKAWARLLVTDGTDIRTVCHPGKTIPARLRTALELRDPTCVVPGCEATFHLEIDHVLPYTDGGATCLANTARLCSHHHDLKTYAGYRLSGSPGTWQWDAPREPADSTIEREGRPAQGLPPPPPPPPPPAAVGQSERLFSLPDP